MADDGNAIRFKRGEVEFELVGPEADVRSAWSALRDVVIDSFREAPLTRVADDEGAAAAAPEPRKKAAPKKRTRKPHAAKSGDLGDREAVKTQLLEADVTEFPDAALTANARLQGYAALRWARDALGVERLTPGEIQLFFQERFGIVNTTQAYRKAFRGRGKEVLKSGNPAEFKLMKPGEDALDAHLHEAAAAASADSAPTKERRRGRR